MNLTETEMAHDAPTNRPALVLPLYRMSSFGVIISQSFQRIRILIVTKNPPIKEGELCPRQTILKRARERQLTLLTTGPSAFASSWRKRFHLEKKNSRLT